jgi:transposase InsO family protein
MALRAVLTASHLFGLAAGTHLRKLRQLDDPLADLQARLEVAELRARLAWEVVDILGTRLGRIPEKKRPYFTPEQRFRILEIKNFLAWNAQQAAKVFVVCSNTILNWERSADPKGKSVGVCVRPRPPLRRACDAARHLAVTVASRGFIGNDLASRILARAGWRIAPRSIARYRKESTVVETLASVVPTRVTHPVSASFVNHVWMLDVSEVKQFLGPQLHIAAVFDAFSRAPLALQVFDHKPGARDMGALLKRAARAFGFPKYVITDLGREFTGVAFRRTAQRLGAVQRFAAKDSIKATARLERFWRTLKGIAGIRTIGLPIDRRDLERRLEPVLLFYVIFRPHQGLGGATPAEAFLGAEPAHNGAAEPPRGKPGDGPRSLLDVHYLDPEKRLVILKPTK